MDIQFVSSLILLHIGLHVLGQNINLGGGQVGVNGPPAPEAGIRIGGGIDLNISPGSNAGNIQIPNQNGGTQRGIPINPPPGPVSPNNAPRGGLPVNQPQAGIPVNPSGGGFIVVDNDSTIIPGPGTATVTNSNINNNNNANTNNANTNNANTNAIPNVDGSNNTPGSGTTTSGNDNSIGDYNSFGPVSFPGYGNFGAPRNNFQGYDNNPPTQDNNNNNNNNNINGNNNNNNNNNAGGFFPGTNFPTSSFPAFGNNNNNINNNNYNNNNNPNIPTNPINNNNNNNNNNIGGGNTNPSNLDFPDLGNINFDFDLGGKGGSNGFPADFGKGGGGFFPGLPGAPDFPRPGGGGINLPSGGNAGGVGGSGGINLPPIRPNPGTAGGGFGSPQPQCRPPTAANLDNRFSDAPTPEIVINGIVQEASVRPEVIALANFFNNIIGNREFTPPIDDPNQSCPANYTQLTQFVTSTNVECWLLPPPYQEPVYVANCRCSNCQDQSSSPLGRYGGYNLSNQQTSGCQVQLTNVTLVSFCPLASPVRIVPFRLELPTSCRCRQTPRQTSGPYFQRN